MEKASMSSDTASGQTPGEPQVVAPQDALYGETYFAATAVEMPKRPPLTQDIDVDICVIGGGLAGLTTAYEMARRGWSVAVLESRRVAWNASGRNTGFVLPGFGQSVDKIVERVGPDHARELWTLSQGGVDYVRQTIAESEMQGIAPSEGWLHVSKTDRARQVSDDADLLRSLGADIEVWPERLVRSKLKSDRYFQAIHFPTAFNIHPLNYAAGLAKLAEDAGVRIFEETRALSIDPAGVRKRIETANGRVRAARIVLAGNVHLGELMPEIAQTLMPVHTFVIVTKPLGATLSEAIDYPGSVSDTDWADSHYRIVGGDRLMWCGRMTVWDAHPRRFGRKLRRDLRNRFPQLADAEIDYAWAGTLGLSVHRMPQIGELSSGVWLASGFGGHGINTTAMAGNLITRAMTEGDDRWRLFQPFELVWAGGRAGRIVLQTAYWGQRKYETWASGRSHGSEVRRIRADARAKKEAAAAAERLQAETDAAETARIAAGQIGTHTDQQVVYAEDMATAGVDQADDSRFARRLRKWRDRT
ncbi:NAD(P)/FAD-dependent oxidoreductase [Pseudorhodoplanes sinuspersici]|uniref:Uncharacterized protein n=1 Tax=Pseudorhodoplanes sinuspersici TaxID=1235591 RepID=A0A1W6ZVK2_9HYPH|nr:FAD-binding oxidoreductase [Pseudorhodoplanes sinuspersici]ARQ00785.1 hypothetical protein CAK95_18095 [Pseudorhodoplanes sinuspersici]RKE72398.1 glycine/D-amino acid oxidase-like deaminating enzyme [Pseudorhodoplanes sinuspersici]